MVVGLKEATASARESELRRIECLRSDYDLTLPGLRVVSGLWREVERLREEVRALRRA